MRFLVLLIVGNLLVPGLAFAYSCDNWVAKLHAVEGSVQVRNPKPDTSPRWLDVKYNDSFCKGDVMRVRHHSRAALLLKNNTILRLSPNTTITFTDLSPDKPSSVSLSKGIGHFISRIKQAFEVITPFLNAAIEGTEFVVSVKSAETEITVFEGTVRAYNKQGEVTLTANQTAIAKKGQAPVIRLKANPRDAVSWSLYYPVVFTPNVEQKGLSKIWQQKLRTSHAAYQQGRISTALAKLKDIPDNANSAYLYSYRASLYLSVGQLNQAHADLGRALSVNPQYSPALAMQAVIAIVQNHKRVGLSKAQAAVKADSNSATARLALSYAQQANFDLDNALATLQQAVKIAPRNALVRSRLAEVYLMYGELGEALMAAKKANQLDPQLGRGHSVLGFAYLARIEITQAKTAFNEAIQHDTSDPMARLGLGLTLIREGDLEKGRREIEYATTLDPNNALIRSYLGKAYYEEKRNALAADQFKMAEQLDPHDPTAYFYDAIRKQSDNLPVEALQELEQAIARNDNKAVYRSKLLLDEDSAAQSVNLARFYNRLGFTQLAEVEAQKSLAANPDNYAAHRFLADAYQGRARHDIARVSELLQAQLLQPLNLNALQPQFKISNLSILNNSSRASYNNYNPLFTKNGIAVNGGLMVAGNDTSSDEFQFTTLEDNMMFSFGRFGYKTDGYRKNNQHELGVYNLFSQLELSPATMVQFEVRKKQDDYGDLTLRFNPDNYISNQTTSIAEKSMRLGLRHNITPNLVLLGNAEVLGYDEDITVSVVNTNTHTTENNLELQTRYKNKNYNLIMGLGSFDSKNKNKTMIFGSISSQSQYKVLHKNGYFYHTQHLGNLDITLGLSKDDFQGRNINRNKSNPKFGLQWQLTPSTLFRAASFSTLRRTLTTGQTIEPTQVAGFNQIYNDPAGTIADKNAIALDQKIGKHNFIGIEANRRKLDVPYTKSGETRTTGWEEQLTRLYWNALPANWLSTSVEYQYEILKRSEALHGGDYYRHVATHRLPIKVNAMLGDFNLEIKGTYIKQQGKFVSTRNTKVSTPGNSDFWVLDVAFRYQPVNHPGRFEIGARNLLNERFNYQDTNPDNPEYSPEIVLFSRYSLRF